jgi:tetratricopeptide (TPR) repeat protein
MKASRWVLILVPLYLHAQEMHVHGVPEKLGTVSFSISCNPSVRADFNRSVALLHSFAYSAAEAAFNRVAGLDPQCAIAHWGLAMAQFHQLWEPPLSPGAMRMGKGEVERARTIGSSSHREQMYIKALEAIYENGSVPYGMRVAEYEKVICELSASERADTEAQVFCGLALLASASPMDKLHTHQKRAADLLEPLYGRLPEHPGIAHYLIHAYDSTELAPRGLAAATAYSKIAPSAPHALHMPSHIFTRLGLWQESVDSNLAARSAAHAQGDIGEELHAMDYLVYAYLQNGQETAARDTIQQLQSMSNLSLREFTVSYAATAMPVRYAVERDRWADAVVISDPVGAPPHVLAIAAWARGLGLSRTQRVREAQPEIAKLEQIEHQLQASGNAYWAIQAMIMSEEVKAWSAQAEGKHEVALRLMRHAADQEDAIEKLPVTPGPIIPAREQLGYVLLEQNQPASAVKEFQTALALAPGRRGAIRGLKQASEAANGPKSAGDLCGLYNRHPKPVFWIAYSDEQTAENQPDTPVDVSRCFVCGNVRSFVQGDRGIG